MKKSLIVTLALVFVLGIAGTAFANPYSDVPAGHWAYKAVMDLTKVGVVEGHAGKYYGNANMTRYEMAAITARAMAKADKADAATKATIDKLAVEFSKELNDLGVRVAKLEKNQSSFKWTGDYRMRWVDQDDPKGTDDGSDTQHRLRIAANAKVNENTDIYMRVMAFNHTDFGQWAKGDGNDMDVVDINATVKNFLGFSDLTVGRFSHKIGTTGYYLDSTGRFDGAKIVVPMGDFKLTGAFADYDLYYKQSVADKAYTEPDESEKTSTEIATAQLDWAASKKLTVSAFMLQHAGDDITSSVSAAGKYTLGFGGDMYGFGAQYVFDKDWALAGEWMTVDKANVREGNLNKDADNMHVRLSYKGANKNVAGSWGAFVEYADFESRALDNAPSINTLDGKELIGIGFSNTLAKNVVFNAYYFDYDDSYAGDKSDKYTRAEVNFYF